MRFLSAFVTFMALPLAAVAADARAITGSVTYREKIALPPGAEMLIQLRDPKGQVIATAGQLTDGQQVPIPFAVEGPAGKALTLRAALRENGRIRWLSAPVEVKAGPAPAVLGPVILRGFTPMGYVSTLSCGDVVAEVGFQDNAARLRVGGAYIDLVPTRTGSGARYMSETDPGTWIWTKGDVALLSLSGTELPECQALLPRESYVARGNEPGWHVEIAGGQMHFVTDYGQSETTVPLPAPVTVDGARRYADAGLSLTLRQALHRDDMTGMPYPDTAVIKTGGKMLTGSGGDPADLLTAHPWTIDRIEGVPVIPDFPVTLRFEPSGKVSGRPGCNTFSGSYDLTGEGLRFGPAAMSMMACIPELSAQEDRFMAALRRVDRFDIADDGSLILIAAGTPVITAHR